MERFNGAIAVITGSSVGIGASIIKHLLPYGVTVVGLARRVDKLQELKEEVDKGSYKGKFIPVKCDVTNEEQIKSSFEWIVKNVGKPSILINNAGVCIRSLIEDASVDVIDATFNINVKGVIVCAKEAIRIMKENSIEGHIVNVCSIAGHPTWIPKRGVSLYSSSKHAVKVISDGLRRELIDAKLRIKISNLSPGLVVTDMTAMYGHDNHTENEILKPEDISNACIAVLNTPPNVLISELTVLPIHEYC